MKPDPKKSTKGVLVEVTQNALCEGGQRYAKGDTFTTTAARAKALANVTKPAAKAEEPAKTDA